MSSGYFPTFSYGKYSDNLSNYSKDIFTHGVVRMFLKHIIIGLHFLHNISNLKNI